jgi:hypothetical protein
MERTRIQGDRRRRALIVLAPILAAGAVAAFARAGKTVVYHGAVVSSDVSMVGGRPYVPLADMARVLGGKVTSRGDGYEIVTGEAGGGASGDAASRTAAGGANEVRGQNGKVGDLFFNGYWRFQVKSVDRAQEYTYRFSPNAYTAKPNGANDELVVVTCQIKNGQKQAEEPILTAHGLNTQQTALTDDQGQSFAPMDFDVRGGALSSGAAKPFAVIFSVPKGTKLQTLIFTLYGFGNTSNKATHVRVALSP